MLAAEFKNDLGEPRDIGQTHRSAPTSNRQIELSNGLLWVIAGPDKAGYLPN
jgi:hypothetical protein